MDNMPSTLSRAKQAEIEDAIDWQVERNILKHLELGNRWPTENRSAYRDGVGRHIASSPELTALALQNRREFNKIGKRGKDASDGDPSDESHVAALSSEQPSNGKTR